MKKLVALLLVFCMMFTLVACSNGTATKAETTEPAKEPETKTDTSESTAEASDSGELETIRCGWLTTAIPVPNYYANEQGWYEELGISLEISTFPGGPACNEAVGAGELDIFTMGGMPATLGGIAYEYNIISWLEDDDIALQCYARNNSDIVAAGKGNLPEHPELYGTAETWKGKNIIVTSATSAHYAVCSIVEAFGLDISEVNLIDMDGASGAAAFLAGEGDLYCAWDPQYNSFATDSENYTKVATCGDAGGHFICVTAATKEFCEEHPDLVVKYLRGEARAMDAFANDENLYYSAMLDWMKTYSDVTKETATTSAAIRKMYDFDGLYNWHSADGNGNSELASAMYSIADFMIEQGLIENDDKAYLQEFGWIKTEYMLEALDLETK